VAKRKELDENIKELKTKLLEGKVVLGTERVLKELKTKELEKIFLTSNCLQKIVDDIKYYAKLAGITVVELEQTNEEIGVICKKNFFVSVVGIIK